MQSVERESLNFLKPLAPQDSTEEELMLFLKVCEKYNLDPLTREIVMTKEDGKINFITTRDGYLKIAMRDEDFDGIVSAVVREGDEFEIDASKLEVKHKFGIRRGSIIGAWAMARHKKRPPVIVFVDFNEYKQNTPVWNQYPSAMIQKVAEVAALRRQFNISGLISQEEMHENIEISETQPIIHQSEESIVPEKNSHETQSEPKATEKQLKLIYTLISDIAKLSESSKEEIASEIKQRYGVEHSKDLTISQASRLIEELQEQIKNLKSVTI